MNATAPRRIRIVLAPEMLNEALFEPVFKIALRRRAPVECVCIEDTRLLDIAGLPHARFIHAYSRESSPLDETLVRRAMRVSTGRARERFERTITRTAIAWTFRTRQTTHWSEAFTDATPGDLIVVPLLRGAHNSEQVRGIIDSVARRMQTSLLVLNEVGHPDKSVLAIYDGDRDDVAAAAELAHDFGCGLTVFAIGADRDSAERRADEVQEHLEESGRASDVTAIALDNTAELAEAISVAAPGTLVLDRTTTALDGVDIVALLARSSASLFLRN